MSDLSPLMIGSHALEATAPMQWRRRTAIWTVTLDTVALLAIALGWLGVSGTARLSDQYAWTTVAIIGLLLAGCGNGVWLLRGRRAVGVRSSHLLGHQLGGDGGGAVDRDSAAPPTDGVITWSTDVVIGIGMTRYHRPDCMLVKTKDVWPVHTVGNGKNRARPCDICRP